MGFRVNAENEFVALKKVRESNKPRQTSPSDRQMFLRCPMKMVRWPCSVSDHSEWNP